MILHFIANTFKTIKKTPAIEINCDENDQIINISY